MSATQTTVRPSAQRDNEKPQVDHNGEQDSATNEPVFVFGGIRAIR